MSKQLPYLFESQMDLSSVGGAGSGAGNHSAVDANMSLGMAPGGNITTTGADFPPAVIQTEICQWILYEDIKETRVRVWDLIILIPNALFLMFLLWTMKPAISRLRQLSSPIVTAFFTLVFMVSVISVLRCVVAMTVNASVITGDITDKVIWLVLRFFLLATEISVVIFGLAFGHLDSQTSIRRVLLVTFFFAFIYSCVQGGLEFGYPDPKFHVNSKNYDIFAHGGMIFWMTSSIFFFIVYSFIYILPWTKLKDRLNLPSKRAFYVYVLVLACLDVTQAVGSSLLYADILNGMCVVDLTTYLYFTCFHPLVYLTFLREFFKSEGLGVPQYKYQEDEGGEEDIVSLPYNTPHEPHFPEADNASFDSTHFDRGSATPGSLTPGSINADIFGPTQSYQNP
ncbi:transmembrane protein adipocyte-associated 1 homolog [Mya arenaria]|uniref:transmembrane protein adipocyte-associated 1 homolog n=1 Tax=Mya arenaria TaxID=6604 RepID=UPI0022DEC6DD|nr:transmembrane protein adipocyte-associated 1 homolog [Mya arenaria]XP_052781584.1 transmembrane protein adipocyte-associated 1 homolog [Mya arenaria]